MAGIARTRREVCDMAFLSVGPADRRALGGRPTRRRRVTRRRRRSRRGSGEIPSGPHVTRPAVSRVRPRDGGRGEPGGPGRRRGSGTRGRGRDLRRRGGVVDPARPVLRRRQDGGRGPRAGGLHPVRPPPRPAPGAATGRRPTCARSSSTWPATTTGAASSPGGTARRRSPTPRRRRRPPRSGPSGPRWSPPCKALPRRQRDCVTLRYYYDMPVAQIAATLGLSVNTVKTHLQRGLDALGSTLEADR